MNLKKSLMLGVLIGGIVLGSIGCGKQEEKSLAYHLDIDNIETVLPYTRKGNLNMVETEIENFKEGEDLVVRTFSGTFSATYVDGILYYIGKEPNEDGVIENVYTETTKSLKLKPSDFEIEVDSATYKLKEKNPITGAIIHSEGVPLQTDFFPEDGFVELKTKKEGIEGAKDLQVEVTELDSRRIKVDELDFKRQKQKEKAEQQSK